MELSEAKELLNACVREELRDHAFGDVEVYWRKDRVHIAAGYFSGTTANVWFIAEDEPPSASFNDRDASELRTCGTNGHISRNDEVGPDNYVEGKIMPALTKEGVLEEISRPHTIPDSQAWDSNGDLW